jgi:hypothetical protein
MIQTMLELNNPFDAYARGLGYCMVMIVIAPSSLSNPQFIVRVYGSGDIRVVDQNDLKVYGVPFIDGLHPDIPEEWKSKL